MNTRKRGNDPGPAAAAVAHNVSTLRQMRGMTQRALSIRLWEIDRHIPEASIAKLEAGDRRIDVDDLVALARVLDSTPTSLLTPPEERKMSEREVNAAMQEINGRIAELTARFNGQEN